MATCTLSIRYFYRIGSLLSANEILRPSADVQGSVNEFGVGVRFGDGHDVSQ